MVDPDAAAEYFYDYGKRRDLVSGRGLTFVNGTSDDWVLRPQSVECLTDDHASSAYVDHEHPVNLSGTGWTFMFDFEIDFDACDDIEVFTWGFNTAGVLIRFQEDTGELDINVTYYWSGGNSSAGISGATGTSALQRRRLVLSLSDDLISECVVFTERGISTRTKTITTEPAHHATNDQKLLGAWNYGPVGKIYSMAKLNKALNLAECIDWAKKPYSKFLLPKP